MPDTEVGGALSNPRVRESWSRLAAKMDALARSNRQPRVRSVAPVLRRPNQVRRAITQVLAESETSMSVAEIFQAVEQALGKSVV